jgi:hypothetical protein
MNLMEYQEGGDMGKGLIRDGLNPTTEVLWGPVEELFESLG